MPISFAFTGDTLELNQDIRIFAIIICLGL
jgi:hypothetical protein